MRISFEQMTEGSLYRVPLGDALRTLDRLMTVVDSMGDKLRGAGATKNVRVTINFDQAIARIYMDGDA